MAGRYFQHSALTRIASAINSTGVMTTAPIPAATMLFSLPLSPAHIFPEPDVHTIQVGPDLHYSSPLDKDNTPQDWVFLNHACTPAATVTIAIPPLDPSSLSSPDNPPPSHSNDSDPVFPCAVFSAASDLDAGTELTFDYNTTERSMFNPFSCLCGSPSCVGTVSGYANLSPDQRSFLASTIPPSTLFHSFA